MSKDIHKINYEFFTNFENSITLPMLDHVTMTTYLNSTIRGPS